MKDYILGLRNTFIKRYIVERTSEAEIRPEEQNEKAKSCRGNLRNEIQSKGPSSVDLCQKYTTTSPPHEGEPAGTQKERKK